MESGATFTPEEIIEYGIKPEPTPVGDLSHVIPSWLIVAVSGDPRAGTSHVMQDCRVVGLPVGGHRFLRIRAKKLHKLNPRGFYEYPGVVSNGLRTLDQIGDGGKVVKIIASGLLRTNHDLVHRYIFCLRDPREVANSQTDLGSAVEAVGEDGEWTYRVGKPHALFYLRATGQFLVWLTQQPESVMDRVLMVDRTDRLNDPVGSMEQIAAHLGFDLTDSQRQAVRDNLDPDMAHPQRVDWDAGTGEAGEVADAVYASLKSGDRGDMLIAADAVRAFALQNRLEHQTWFDAGFQAWVTPAFMRQAYESPEGRHGCRRKMKAQAVGKTRQKDRCDRCPFFSESSDTYTVELPMDMAPLIRPLVECARDDDQKTLEQCETCWRRGQMITVDGEPVALSPQRLRDGEDRPGRKKAKKKKKK